MKDEKLGEFVTHGFYVHQMDIVKKGEYATYKPNEEQIRFMKLMETIKEKGITLSLSLKKGRNHFYPDRMFMVLPDCDENLTPVSKMPNCPRCEEDELLMNSEHSASCLHCNLKIEKAHGK